MLRAVSRCFGICGRATCFGASTTTLGSKVSAPLEGLAVCDITGPLRPHSAIDKKAIAGFAAKSDENLIASVLLSNVGTANPIP